MKKTLMLMAMLTTLAPAALAATKPLLLERHLLNGRSGELDSCVVFTDGTAKVSGDATYEDAANVDVVFTAKNVRSKKFRGYLQSLLSAGIVKQSGPNAYRLDLANVASVIATAQDAQQKIERMDPQQTRYRGRQVYRAYAADGKYVELNSILTSRVKDAAGNRVFKTRKTYREGGAVGLLFGAIELACLAAANPAK
jgi:hypothetical protein